MKGILFNEFHSYNDFSLILNNKIIGSAAAKTEYVEVLGADGQLDLTEAFGDIKYNNRTLTFVFSLIEYNQDWATAYTNISNALNGKQMKVTLDDDPDYYYLGRISVSDYESSKRIGKITITVNAEPYKYKNNKTIITSVVNGSLSVDYYNARKTVIPKITTTDEVQVTFNNTTYTISGSGTHFLTDIIFRQGINTLTFTGTANVSVEYQEGDL